MNTSQVKGNTRVICTNKEVYPEFYNKLGTIEEVMNEAVFIVFDEGSMIGTMIPLAAKDFELVQAQ